MFSNGIKFLLAFLIIGNASAITPQKYCENLAATSCEVLNISVDAKVVIKYCRNRKFKVTVFDGPSAMGIGTNNVQAYVGGTPVSVTLTGDLCTTNFPSGDPYLN